MPRTELHFYEDNIGSANGIIRRIKQLSETTDDPFILQDLADCAEFAKRIKERNKARLHAQKLNGGTE